MSYKMCEKGLKETMLWLWEIPARKDIVVYLVICLHCGCKFNIWTRPAIKI